MTPDEERHRRIARVVAIAANQLVPPGFAVEQVGGGIKIISPDGVHSWQGVGSDDVVSSAGLLLDSLQNVVCETIRDVWPLAEGRRHGTTPTWRVEMVGSTLRLWYEYDGKPV